MNTKSNKTISSKLFITTAIFAGLTCLSSAADKKAGKAEASASPSAAPQKAFKTPQEAMDNLVQAATSFDVAALKQILGPGSDDIVSSEDTVMDKERASNFVTKAKEKSAIEIDPKNPDHATIAVGEDDFPLPIPLVKHKAGWTFDTKAGRNEILFRRIGANELDAIAVCRGYVDAQKTYALERHDDSRVNQYAQRIISTQGKHDGLAWQNADGAWEGPVGEGVAKAINQGYTEKDKPQPYHGYYYKILKGQGAAAPMGAMDYMVGGAMIGGFALAAAPAQYRVTGVKTFIVSQSGVVYEKDLGPDTLKTFKAMDTYNPDKTWHETDDEW